MQIQKYHIPFQPEAEIIMPVGAKLLSVVAHEGALWLYAEVRTGMREEKRHIRLIALGEEYEAHMYYIATVHCQGAVMHIFEDPTK